MSAPTGIAMTKRLKTGYTDTVARVKAALAAEGFGVLTEIDVQHTLKQKLDVDFRDYVIIGACNPPLANRALQQDLEVGVLLPCNVIVYVDGDDTVVSAFDPVAGMGLMASPPLEAVAREAHERLTRMLAAL